MQVKVIVVEFKIFGPNIQTCLKDDNIELVVNPVKGDKIFIDGEAYIVLQRDLHLSRDPNKQKMTLFVEKCY